VGVADTYSVRSSTRAVACTTIDPNRGQHPVHRHADRARAASRPATTAPPSASGPYRVRERGEPCYIEQLSVRERATVAASRSSPS